MFTWFFLSIQISSLSFKRLSACLCEIFPINSSQSPIRRGKLGSVPPKSWSRTRKGKKEMKRKHHCLKGFINTILNAMHGKHT
jgi:hypothetical protein